MTAWRGRAQYFIGRSPPSRFGLTPLSPPPCRTGPLAADAASRDDTFVTVGHHGLEVRARPSGEVIRTLGHRAGQITRSRSGSTIYYQGPVGGPAAGIYALALTGGEPLLLGFGSAPAESPDGATLAFAGADGHTLNLRELESTTTAVVELGAAIGPQASLHNTGTLIAWVTDTLLLVVPMPARSSLRRWTRPGPVGAAEAQTRRIGTARSSRRGWSPRAGSWSTSPPTHRSVRSRSPPGR